MVDDIPARKWGQAKWDDCYLRVTDKVKALGNRFELIRKRSWECADLLPELDFVELDGDHSYDGVWKDIECYEKKLVHGGLICGHDYYGKTYWIEGVYKAVNEYAEVHGRELHADKDAWTWWWFVP